MAILRSELEFDIVDVVKGYLVLVGRSIVDDGTNPDLNSAIGFAVRRSGFLVASRLTVTDLDLAPIADEFYDQLVDLSIYRVLLNIQGSMTMVDTTAGPFTQKYSQAYKPLKDLLDWYRQRVSDFYKTEDAQPVGGVITQVFSSHYDVPPTDPWTAYYV